MSQIELTVATRGNHAAILPATLIATSINEARPNPVIKITYEDTAVLNESEKAIVQMNTGDKTTSGTINVIQELQTQFPFLAGKDTKLVRYPAVLSSYGSNALFFHRRTSGSLSWMLSLLWTSRPSTLSFSASIPTSFSVPSLSATPSPLRTLLCGVPSAVTVLQLQL